MRENKNFQKPKKAGAGISFVVDGKCERWYIELLQQQENLRSNFKPKLPQKKKLKDQSDLVIELSKESEKVFWIIDFDTILEETRKAKKGAKAPLREFQELYNQYKNQENIIIIVNNPCLEYWYLLHFEHTSKYFATYERLEKPLKKYLPDYEKSEKYYKNPRLNIYKRLKNNLPEAIVNAQKLGEFDFGEIQTAGIAEMHKIFEELNIVERKK
ncbi:hypothetical protein FACS189415_6540 [Bacteroidia bacterium]|nr:hypothetical protein FACS189415_6540 [Bacteroidia bacterium]